MVKSKSYILIIVFISTLSFLSCQTDQPSSECSEDFKTQYNTLQEDFKSTFTQEASNINAQTLKQDLQTFLSTYPENFKCSWNGKVVDVRGEIKSLHDEINVGKQKSIQKVIYGEDDRLDVVESSDTFKQLAKSVAGMIKRSDINSDYTVESETIGESLQLCSNERFYHQKNPMMCTGFLVGEDVLVTAGHCIEKVSDCSQYSFVFEYKSDTTVLKPDDIYNCTGLISREFYSNGRDYAVVKLDRKVIDRPILKFRKTGKIADGAGLFVIGHPSGLPLKVAGGAYVRDNTDADFMTTNLDTFGGNSGSPVFNETTKEVEGILVRGEEDYTYDLANNCYKVNKCTMTGCNGEDVTRITKVKNLPIPTIPIDGGWSSWSNWGKCQGGYQNRSRTCTNPPPSYGGNDCTGPSSENRKCVNLTRDEVLSGLFENNEFANIQGKFYSLKTHTQSNAEISGRKFLSVCALYSKNVSGASWHSFFVGDCISDKIKIENIYDDFVMLVTTD